MKNFGLIIALAFLACGFSACNKTNDGVKKASWTCPGCQCTGDMKCGCSPENGCKCKGDTTCNCEPVSHQA